MKKSTIAQLLIMGSVSWGLQAAQAANIGMPLYEGDIEGKKGSVEFYYDQYKEDYVGHQKDYSVPTPQYDYVGSYNDEFEADRSVARIDYYANKRFAFYAETGTTDFTDRTEKAFLFGAGLRAKVYASSLFDVNLSASMTYIPEVKGEIYAPQTPLGDQYLIYESSYYKISGGLIISKLIPLNT
ncbi:MAG: hypothetical protein D3904_14930, partial [Candidatus Electrothrix sp. EH2]|nr:hypothetical protein [Candidatus Electrothrix sp. EH2]